MKQLSAKISSPENFCLFIFFNKKSKISIIREESSDTYMNVKQTKSHKEAFRQHQRDLPFGEKMQIAFALTERDKIIRRAVLLPKKTKDEKSK
ncbi:MAG: hypothetical protein M3Q99_19415 [Acidobacteriota bacterium]|nr:hypothetical protein [Acidobacteriota bacterium]